MALTELTKVTGPGIHTLSNVLSHNIKSSGIITATKFSGPLDSIGGNFAGVITATNGVFSGNISAVDGNFSGNVTIGGTLTYEDVTNIDSVGIITARDGLKVLGGGANIVGVVTATTFKGDGDFVELDVDGHTNLDNVSIVGVSTFTGTVNLSAINSTASALTIHNTADRVLIKGSNRIDLADDQVRFQNRAQNASLLDATSSYVKLYQSGNEKLATTSTGIDITGMCTDDGARHDGDVYFIGATSGRNAVWDMSDNALEFADNAKAVFGTGSDLEIFNDGGTLSFIRNNNGKLVLRSDTFQFGTQDGAHRYIDIPDDEQGVGLFYDDVKRIETTSSGALISGNLELSSTYPSLTWTDTNHNSDYRITNNDGTLIVYDNTNSRHVLDFQPDGDIKLPVDNKKLMFGAGDDLKIYHSTFNYIESYNDSEIHINANTGGSVENMAKFKPNGAVELYHNGTKKAETSTQGLLIPNTLGVSFGDAGCKVTGTAGSGGSAGLFFMTNSGNKWQITGDGHFKPSAVGSYDIGSTTAEIGNVYLANSKKVYFGSTQTLSIHNDGSNSLITDSSSAMFVRSNRILFQNSGGTEGYGEFNQNGSVYWTHDNIKRIETTATGIEVTGEVAASQDYPNFRPTLDLNFAGTAKLDTRVTFTRQGSGTYYGKDGLVKFASTNEPRFDHDPVTRECKGLLIEEQRQNMFPYTTRPGDSGWTNSKSGTFTQNTTETAAPDGTFTATKWTFTNTDPYLYDQQNLSANTSYTLSMWVKAGTNMAGDRLQMRIGGAPYSSGDAEVIPADGTWRRVTYTRTIGGSAENSASIGFEPQTSPSGNPASGDVIYIWGPQLEEGAFVTSYISSNSNIRPIRGNESLEIDGEDFTDFFNATEGTVLSHITPLNGSLGNHSGTGGVVWSFDAGGSFGNGNYFSNSNGTTAFGHSVLVGSSGQNAGGGTGNQTNGVPFKNATVFKKDDFIMATNGTLAVADTSGNLPTVVKLVLGNNGWGNGLNAANIHFNRFAYYSKRLPNTQLVTLTS